MIFWLLLVSAVQWQSTITPVDDSLNRLTVYFNLPSRDIKFLRGDSGYQAQYEIQFKVYNDKNEQIAGDFWRRERREDTTDIADSVCLVIPRAARRFELRLLDLEAYEVLLITDKIAAAKYLHDIRWFMNRDTLLIRFTVANLDPPADRLSIRLDRQQVELPLRSGLYPDSARIDVVNLANGEYPLRLEVRSGKQKFEEITRPMLISRSFYLDDRAWQLKVRQLEYIAKSEEMERLKNAPRDDRQTYWKQFWAQYDPTPATEFNEREQEYFDRIAYCEAHFSHGDRGWRSDRAKIYMRYGPADEVQSMPYELGSRPYEIWFYYKLNVKYYFVDRTGVGEYLLINPGGSRI